MSGLRRRTGRPNPSRETKFSGVNGDRAKSIFPVQLTMTRIDNHTRFDPYSAESADHAYILHVLVMNAGREGVR